MTGGFRHPCGVSVAFPIACFALISNARQSSLRARGGMSIGRTTSRAPITGGISLAVPPGLVAKGCVGIPHLTFLAFGAFSIFPLPFIFIKEHHFATLIHYGNLVSPNGYPKQPEQSRIINRNVVM